MKKKIFQIHPGDKIKGTDGKVYNVVDETDIHIPFTMFRIEFSNGAVECSGDHHWRYYYNDIDILTDTYDLELNFDFFLNNKIQFGKKDSLVYIKSIKRIAPKLVKCIEVDAPDHMFLGYTSSNKEIYFSNCGFRVFCGRATESGASMVALDNTLATTIDSTYKGAGIIQSEGIAEFCRFYFSEFDDLREYYNKRGLNDLGYSDIIKYDDVSSVELSGTEEVVIDREEVTYTIDDESVTIDKRQDQEWNEVD